MTEDGMKNQLFKAMNQKKYEIRIDRAGIFRFPSSYKFECHSHEAVEINYVLSGCCTMGVDDHYVSLKKGDCIIIYRHVPHSFMVNVKQICRLTQLEFDLNLPDSDYRITFFNEFFSTCRFRKCTGCEEIGDYIDHIAKQTKKEKGEAAALMLDLKFGLLYLELSAQIEKMRSKEDEKEIFSEILEYVHDNFTGEIDMEKLCGQYGVSSRYIRKRFQKDVGMNSSQYINMLRVNKAKELMWDFSTSITNVAFTTGFNSSQYFCRVFKMYTQMTPAEYRKMWSESKMNIEWIVKS